MYQRTRQNTSDPAGMPQQSGGVGTGQLTALKRLQNENERLRKAVLELTLDKLIPTEAARGDF